MGRTTRRGVRGIGLAVVAVVTVVSIGVAAWAFVIEPASLRVVEHPLVIAGWPTACNDLRIAVLADLHVGSPFNGLDRLADIVERTNATKPDLVLLPGDFVIQHVIGGTFVAPEDIAAVLAGLRAPAGVFAVLGNHDWVLGAPRVRAALARASIPVLDDAALVLAHRGCRFRLIGVSDLWEGPHDVARALASVPASGPAILFTHNPDVFAIVPSSVDLVVAGHTHGGQVDLPLLGRLVVPSSFGRRYAAGHVVENGHHLFVSTGIGTSIVPVRFRVPPEISVLVIRNE